MTSGFLSVRALRALICPFACALLTSCLEPGEGVSSARVVRPAAKVAASGTHLLILDEDAIDNGTLPNKFSARDVNDDVAAVGVRKTLRYFRDHIGKEIVLPAGKVGDEGWFAPKTVWAAWSAAGPKVGDGFRNYVVAGPGLGDRDAKRQRETLLDKVPDVAPLGAAGLAALKGRAFCAVVMDGDVRMQNLSPLKADLRGPNLGKAAFEVLQVSSPSGRTSELPEVKIRILDAEVVCKGSLAPLPGVPVPGTYCDNDGGACRPNELLIEESWNTLDTTKWIFDGDGMVADGFFQAREGARSAVADWIMPCPVRLESNSAVRFANRLRLELAEQHDFAEAGALFFVQAGEKGTSEDYVFLNVGYTMAPSKVFVELFGADGGVQFDQFMETSLDHQTTLDFDVDLWIDRGSYRVGVNGEAIDTVTLSKPIESLTLFEVGAQQLGLGLRGLVDETGITRTCTSECKHRPRKGERCEPRTHCKRKDGGSGTCHAKKNPCCCHLASKQSKKGKAGSCCHLASKHGKDGKADPCCHHVSKHGKDGKADPCCHHVSKHGKDGKADPRCSHHASKHSKEGKADSCCCHLASKHDKYGKGGKGGSQEAFLAEAEVWGAASPNPCGKNDLIRMARAKVSEVAEPLEGLRILAEMPLAPNCEE